MNGTTELAWHSKPLLLHLGSDCAVQMVEVSRGYARGAGWGKAIKRRRWGAEASRLRSVKRSCSSLESAVLSISRNSLRRSYTEYQFCHRNTSRHTLLPLEDAPDQWDELVIHACAWVRARDFALRDHQRDEDTIRIQFPTKRRTDVRPLRTFLRLGAVDRSINTYARVCMCVFVRVLSSYDHAACSRGKGAERKERTSNWSARVARGRNLESPLPVMKAMVVSPLGGRVPPDHRGVLHNGLGIGGTRRDLEAEEVAAYLTKLRSLVPDMPRKRKLSKLEVIQRVIEYICDLQTALEETNAAHQDATMTTTPTTTTQSSRQSLLNAATTTASTITTSVVMTTTTSATATVAERWPADRSY